jgi:hypothetical protein
MAHIGQTSRSLRVRFSKHNRYIRTNNPKSVYALCILNNSHEYSHQRHTDIDKIMLKRNMNQKLGKFLHTNLLVRRTTDWRTTYPWPQPTFYYSAGTAITQQTHKSIDTHIITHSLIAHFTQTRHSIQVKYIYAHLFLLNSDLFVTKA